MHHKIQIIGNLGRDPEMRYTTSGQAVTNFSVASNRKYTTSDGQQVDETVWFKISAWGRMAEVCNQYLKKGRQVFVEGRLNPDPQTGGPRVWTGNGGQPRASYEVTALDIKFLGGRGGDAGQPANDQTEASGNIPEDDIPF